MSIITADYEAADLLFRHLDTDGDGGGTKNANGNYASVAEEFYIQPPAGQAYVINRMLVHIEDAGNFTANIYGAGSLLTNGVNVSVRQSGGQEIVDLLDGVPVVDNAHWGGVSYDTDYVSFGAGNNSFNVRWTFAKSGVPIVLQNQEKLVVNLRDDFSGLVEHYFLVQGFKTELFDGRMKIASH
jgi:hypothetical protein